MEYDKATASDSGKNFTSEVHDYSNDVSKDTVAAIRSERGVDVSASKWKLIDSLGQVVPAKVDPGFKPKE